MKISKGILRATISLILLSSIMLGAVSCSRPPEYSEIEDRFISLVEKSQEVNDLLFGEGLVTYERLSDPKNNIKVIKGESEGDKNIYYYEFSDATYGRVIAYRNSYLIPYAYARVTEAKDNEKEPIWQNGEGTLFAYALEDYVEVPAEFYYTASDPTDYDYVRFDSEIASVEGIKILAESVYSKAYLEDAVYEMLFTGALTPDGAVMENSTARFFEYTNESGSVYLMELNSYEPIVKEARLYDFSTARIVRPYKKNFVNIRIESYLASSPDNRIEITLTMRLQDGEWYLDSPTY